MLKRKGKVIEKKERYNINPLMDIGADINAVIGARTNGKSYQAKLWTLRYCLNNNKQFVYLRRWDKEGTNEKIEKYFADMEEDAEGNRRIYELTNGECDCMTVWRHSIYLCKTNDKGKKERIREIGYAMLIKDAESYKSSAFPMVDVLLWEEVITNAGYVPREMEKVMSIISTVFRDRIGIIIAIANTIATQCPAFMEWGIDYRKLQQGAISVVKHHTKQKNDDVTIKIAIEYTANTVKQSMIFGKSKKMIVDGDWETRDYPKLPEHLSYYRTWYTMYVIYNDFKFIIRLLTDNNKYAFLYVYPCTKKQLPDNARIVTDVIQLSYNVTPNMSIYRTKYDKLVRQLLTEKRVTFSDNLTATGFYQTLTSLGHTEFRKEYAT